MNSPTTAQPGPHGEGGFAECAKLQKAIQANLTELGYAA